MPNYLCIKCSKTVFLNNDDPRCREIFTLLCDECSGKQWDFGDVFNNLINKGGVDG